MVLLTFLVPYPITSEKVKFGVKTHQVEKAQVLNIADFCVQFIRYMFYSDTTSLKFWN